ncbi:MAG: hypothetical protein IPP74_11730 [Alphaproteobacteria bacterium]|nr:hypothetical protein [Alphaproteobacteria bacterium]
MFFLLHPCLYFFVGALLLWYTPRALRMPLILIIPGLSMVSILALATIGTPSLQWQWALFGMAIKPIIVQHYSTVFALGFSCVALLGGLFLARQASPKEISLGYAYTAGALAIAYAGDFITLFISFEWMAMLATILIMTAQYPHSLQAAGRYLMMHLLGGIVLFAGIAGHVFLTHDLSIISLDIPLSSFSSLFFNMKLLYPVLIALGLLLHCAAFPLHGWLTDAYPESSPGGFVFLTAMTTKAAIFALILILPGVELLVYIGLITAVWAMYYAIIENDIRRMLSYSLVSQIGLMLITIGVGTSFTLQATAMLAIENLIAEALLAMVAGTIIIVTNKHKLSDLGGLYRTMPALAFVSTVGSLTLSALPGTIGFVAKHLSLQSLAPYDQSWLSFAVLTLGSASILQVGFRFTWMIFFNRDAGFRKQSTPFSLLLPSFIAAFICLILGVVPQFLFSLLPGHLTFDGYVHGEWYNQCQLILYSIIGFFVVYPLLVPVKGISLDIDWLYRIVLRHILLLGEYGWMSLMREGKKITIPLLLGIKHMVFKIGHKQSILARNWPIGVSVLSLTIMLGVYLLTYYR